MPLCTQQGISLPPIASTRLLFIQRLISITHHRHGRRYRDTAPPMLLAPLPSALACDNAVIRDSYARNNALDHKNRSIGPGLSKITIKHGTRADRDKVQLAEQAIKISGETATAQAGVSAGHLASFSSGHSYGSSSTGSIVGFYGTLP